MRTTAVALLAKAPVAGEVKTRFCPPCTPEEAAGFARAFLRDTATMLDRFESVDRWCSYLGSAGDLQELLGGELLPQRGNDLGERIANATADLFAKGYDKVVALCADAPTVDAPYMERTLELLEQHDVVFAPARDGGCLHVALSRPAELFFRNVEMSTDHVLADMVKLAREHGYSHAVMEERYDLDYLQDLIDAVGVGELRHARHTSAALQSSRFGRRTITAEELAEPLHSFTDATRTVLDNIEILGVEVVSVHRSHLVGRVVAYDLQSRIDVPPFDNASMDGYAVDTRHLDIANATKIMTGWPVPPGSDAIVPWEHVDETTLLAPVAAGQFIRWQGEDVSRDDVIVEAGERLTPAHLGLISACGHAQIAVYKQARVAVLVAGDELIEPGHELKPGAIYDSNSIMLRGLLGHHGAIVTSIDRIGDTELDASHWFETNARDVDAIVTAGGASVGEHDWLRTVVGNLGTIDMWRVALKPGKPFAFGRVNDIPVFVLPGNPASVMACSHAFVLPALRKMMGKSPAPQRHHAMLTDEVAAPSDRTFLCPVAFDGTNARPSRAASSSVLSNHLSANAYAVVPPGGLLAGTSVVVELFVWWLTCCCSLPFGRPPGTTKPISTPPQ